MIGLAIILFAIGVYGVISRKDILRIVISVAIMLAAITLTSVALSDGALGQTLVLFVWIIEIVEIVFGLALFLYLGRQDIDEMEELRW